MKNRSVRFSIL